MSQSSSEEDFKDMSVKQNTISVLTVMKKMRNEERL